MFFLINIIILFLHSLFVKEYLAQKHYVYLVSSCFRKIATLTYRSGPEWNERFGRNRVQNGDFRLPRIDGAEFEIEDYIRHQVNIMNCVKFYFNILRHSMRVF